MPADFQQEIAVTLPHRVTHGASIALLASTGSDLTRLRVREEGAGGGLNEMAGRGRVSWRRGPLFFFADWDLENPPTPYAHGVKSSTLMGRKNIE
jgi:hypothetical protein